MKKNQLFILIVMLFAISCIKSQQQPNLYPNNVTIVNEEQYIKTKTDNYSITHAQIQGDSLTITIGASGCSGETWVAGLVASSSVAESYPVQRYIRLSLDNKELCLAVFNRKFSFDLKPLQVNGENKISFNLDKWSQPLIYNY